MKTHRQGINPGFLTRHRLSLNGLNKANAAAIYAELDGLLQVDEVHVDLRRSSISVTYDASHHNIDEIIDVVVQHGASVKDSWWSRTRLGWQRQTDENIRANAKHEPFCCNKVPRR